MIAHSSMYASCGQTQREPRSLAEQLSVLVVGAGQRGLGVHLPVITGHPTLQLAGIVDTCDRAQHLRGSREIPSWARVFGCLNEAIGSVQPRLAIVATPHGTHDCIVSELLDRSIPCFVDKPLSVCSTSAKSLLTRASQAGISVNTLLPYRHLPALDELKKAMSEATRPLTIHIRSVVRRSVGIGSWRSSKELAGGGVLFDLGHHFVDYFLHAVGVPSIGRVSTTFEGSSSVESGARVELSYPASCIDVILDLEATSNREAGLTIDVVESGQSVLRLERREPRDGSWPDARALVRRQIDKDLASGFLNPTAPASGRNAADQVGVLEIIERMYARSTSRHCECGLDGPDG